MTKDQLPEARRQQPVAKTPALETIAITAFVTFLGDKNLENLGLVPHHINELLDNFFRLTLEFFGLPLFDGGF